MEHLGRCTYNFGKKWPSCISEANPHFDVTGWTKTSPAALKFWSDQNLGENMTGCFDPSWLEISFNWKMSLKFSLVSSTGIHFAFFEVFLIFLYHFSMCKNWGKGSPRKQPTLCNTTSGFFPKWSLSTGMLWFNNNHCHTNREWSHCGLRNECPNSIVFLTGWSKFSSLHDQPEALPWSAYWVVHIISMEFLQAFLRQTSFCEEAEKKKWTAGFFLRLRYGLLE